MSKRKLDNGPGRGGKIADLSQKAWNEQSQPTGYPPSIIESSNDSLDRDLHAQKRNGSANSLVSTAVPQYTNSTVCSAVSQFAAAPLSRVDSTSLERNCRRHDSSVSKSMLYNPRCLGEAPEVSMQS